MKLYRTQTQIVVEHQACFFAVDAEGWDELICSVNLQERIQAAASGTSLESFDPASALAPVTSQEVWAAGVTYYRSRNARIDESKDSGGGTFYDRVYSAERPELFFKSVGSRVVGPGQPVRIRKDAKWSVPEPELTVLLNPARNIVGFTIGNDMSSRDIEGENPLYLPQAKMYDGSCALGPCILLTSEVPARTTAIHLQILREGVVAFNGSTTLAELKREIEQLSEFLFREMSFPVGVFLMTGTGVVPGDGFTLAHSDVIRISIDGIGTLENTVA